MMPFGRGGRGLEWLERWRVGVGMWREQPYNMIHMLIAFSGHSHSPFGDGGRLPIQNHLRILMNSKGGSFVISLEET